MIPRLLIVLGIIGIGAYLLFSTHLPSENHVLNTLQPKPAAFAAGLSSLPKNWPTVLHIGLNNPPGGASAMKAIAPYGFRYQYLAGGVNTGGGWRTWNANSDFPTFYIQDSLANGMTPVFTYYMLFQSTPGNAQSELEGVHTNLNNTATMTAYYNDFKVLMQKIGAFPNNLVVIHVDPDVWGYVQKRATGDNAAVVPAKVSSTGLSELAGLPENVAGFGQALIRLRNQYAPNALLGYHLSIWGTDNDIVYSDPPDATVDQLGTRAANFYTSLGANYDLIFGEFNDRDAAFKQFQYNDGGGSWYNDADRARNLRFWNKVVSLTNKRFVIWQMPFGNTKMKAENNTWNHYQDNHVEYFFDEPARTHLQSYINAGAIAFMFGKGADGGSGNCDCNNDGITNPAPINGNTRDSINADDDGGFFYERSRAYYTTGAMSLPTDTTPTPVPTTTATPLPTPTKTPVPTPTKTPVPTPTKTPIPTIPPTAVPTPVLLQGDADNNGHVDIFDYNIILRDYGQTGTGLQGDVDKNSKVDIFDYNIVLRDYGKSS